MDDAGPHDPPLLRLGGADGFELDAAALELRRVEGEVVALEPRPFRLLQYLVRHRDRVVSKQELLDEVWDGLVVSDSALSTALKHVRRALGDRGNASRWIESRRGRGYRFVATVETPFSVGGMVPPADDPRDLQERSLERVRRGLDQLADLTPSATRDELELELHMALARTMAKARGWAAETLAAWEYASQLCTREGDTRRAGIVRFGLAGGLLSLGRAEDALEQYDAVLRVGHETNDHMLQVAGCIRGVPQMYLGWPRDSAASLRAGLALIRHDDDFMSAGFSEDFSVTLRHWLAWSLWLLGETEASTSFAREAVEVARRGDPFNLGYALVFTGVVALLREDFEAAEALAHEAHAMAVKEQFALFEALAGMEKATVRGLTGDVGSAQEASEEFAAAMEKMAEAGNRSGAGLIFAFLARVQIRAGRVDDARRTIEQALAMSSETGCFFDAELLRLRAGIAHSRGERERALADLEAGLSLAQRQGALALERRIEADRARLTSA